MRDFKKIITLEDYGDLDSPNPIAWKYDVPISNTSVCNAIPKNLMILRMLVKPKYGEFKIPSILSFLKYIIKALWRYNVYYTGIKNSWCYITVRSGLISSKTDDEWHFDGTSFRTGTVPDRNYIWMDRYPTEFKLGSLKFPPDFDPLVHNLYKFAENQLINEEILRINPCRWYFLSPFVLHRRPQIPKKEHRVFCKISFIDEEIRDVNNTQNPLLFTDAYGRDPVKTFRNKLIDYNER